MTSFVENPQDYLGTHRYHSTAPVFQVCDCHEVCGATFRVDDVAPDTGHEPRHARRALGFPYLEWLHGVRVWPDDDITDEDLRSCHSTRFPITHGEHDGYSLGRQW